MKPHQAENAFAEQLQKTQTALNEEQLAKEAAAQSKLEIAKLAEAAQRAGKAERQKKQAFDSILQQAIDAYNSNASAEDAFVKITIEVKGRSVVEALNRSNLFPENTEGVQLTFDTKTNKLQRNGECLKQIAQTLSSLTDVHAFDIANRETLIKNGQAHLIERTPSLISAIEPKIGRVLAVQQDAANSEDSKPV